MKIWPIKMTKQQQSENLEKLAKKAKQNLQKLFLLMKKGSETKGSEKPYGMVV